MEWDLEDPGSGVESDREDPGDSVEWTRSKEVLARMREVLHCHICKDTVVDPMTYGECDHWFCGECIQRHPGGTCPAAMCNASAEIRDIKQHKTIDSLTKSIAKISQIFGDQVPERMKRHLSQNHSDDDDDTEEPKQPPVLLQVDANKDMKKLKTVDVKSPRSDIFDEDDIENLESQYSKSAPAKTTKSRRAPKGKKGTTSRGVSNKLDLKSNLKDSDVDVDLSENARVKKESVKKTTDTSKAQSNKQNKSEPSSTSKPAPPKPKPASKPAESRKKTTATEKRNKKGETVLHQACLKGDLATVTRLLKEGASPNTVDFAGWSPLHEASAAGNTTLVSLLLNHGASPNIHSKELNITPLHDAVENGFADIVRLLVSHGADTRAKNSTGQTPGDLPASESVRDALSNTMCLMTESESMDQSIIQEDLNSVDSVVLSCPESSDSEWKKVCGAANSLGMKKPSRAITENTTHCLLDTGKQFNVLSCQVVGAVCLQDEWILQCRELGALVDTEPFLFLHPDLTQEARTRSRDCRLRGQPKLLTGLHFYLTGGFDAQNLSKAELVKILLLAGAKVINREPNPENLPDNEKTVPHHAAEDSSLVHTSHIILYQEGGKREPLMKYKMAHVKTLPVAWLTQSVMQHVLLDPELFVP